MRAEFDRQSAGLYLRVSSAEQATYDKASLDDGEVVVAMRNR